MSENNSLLAGVSKYKYPLMIGLVTVVAVVLLVITLSVPLSHEQKKPEEQEPEVQPTPPAFDESRWYNINDTTDHLENNETIHRRDFIKKMMKHSWDGYVKYAWGENELKPVSQKPHSDGSFRYVPFGLTIVGSLDTLYIMGMKDEFKKGYEWIANNFNLDQFQNKPGLQVSVFATNVRVVGGLLACFALTGDAMFWHKAELLAKKLLPAFKTRTGIPISIVDISNGDTYTYNWANGNSILAEFGALSMEFGYLSDVTGNTEYQSKVNTIRDVLKGLEKTWGLYQTYLNPNTGKWESLRFSNISNIRVDLQETTIGPGGDIFFEYLLKEWLRTGRKDQEIRRTYDDAMQAILKHLLIKSKDGLMYFSELTFSAEINKAVNKELMNQGTCNSGGMLALRAHKLMLNSSLTDRYKKVAEDITHTCHEFYRRTVTQLGPEVFLFFNSEVKRNDFYLNPKVVESYFFMWRTTKNPKYREWGWEAAQAIHKHCFTSGGYSGIRDVNKTDSQKDDVQPSSFLGETLKYLYLLFSDDTLMPLDQWVFNAAGHPLPVKGVNPYYREMNSTRP